MKDDFHIHFHNSYYMDHHKDYHKVVAVHIINRVVVTRKELHIEEAVVTNIDFVGILEVAGLDCSIIVADSITHKGRLIRIMATNCYINHLHIMVDFRIHLLTQHMDQSTIWIYVFDFKEIFWTSPLTRLKMIRSE